MLLTDDNLVHSHRNHVHKGTLTLNPRIQLTNVYCLTHKIFLYYVFTFLYITLLLVFFLHCAKLAIINVPASLLWINNTNPQPSSSLLSG